MVLHLRAGGGNSVTVKRTKVPALAVLLWIFLLTWFGQSSAQSQGWLWLTFEMPPAAVRVDSLRFKPSGRDTLLPLAAGKHTILAENPYRSEWNWRDFQTSVLVPAGDTLRVAVRFPHYVLLVTSPAGAEVTQGHAILGKTPLILPFSKIRQAPLLLKKAGYFPRTIRAEQIESGCFWLELQPDSSYWARQQARKRRHLARRRRLIWNASGMALLAAASGVSSYLFKRKANRLYTHYLHTPFPRDIRNSYNEAHKYDTYAGTSYIFFEINLIGSTYFVLKVLSFK